MVGAETLTYSEAEWKDVLTSREDEVGSHGIGMATHVIPGWKYSRDLVKQLFIVSTCSYSLQDP